MSVNSIFDQMLNVIDEQNNIVDRLPTSLVHQQGLPHQVSAILIQNHLKQLLIPQLTHPNQPGDLFHSAEGHVKPDDETYEKTAIRQLFQKTKLVCSTDKLNRLGHYWLKKDFPDHKERERFEIFIVKQFNCKGDLLMDKNCNPMWLTIDELLEIYKHDKSKLSYPLLLTIKKFFNLQLQ